MLKEMTELYNKYANLKANDRALVAVVIKQCKKVAEDWKVKIQKSVAGRLREQGFNDLVINTFLAAMDEFWTSHVADEQLENYMEIIGGNYSEPESD